jgi:hypothetical protein
VSQGSPGVILYDANGVPLVVSGGAAIPASGVPVMGSDGANARFLATDASGRQHAVGPAAAGAAAVGAPVLNAGVDGGGLVRTILTDASGNQQVNLAQWLGSTAPTVGQKAMAASIPVTFASDQAALAVTLQPSGSAGGIIYGRVQYGAGAGVLTAIRATAYTEPAAAAQMSMSSSSAADASAGTGARTVRITYYTGTMTGPFTETITLNGTTPVNTVATNIRFIEKLEVITVGSGGANAGTISLFGSTGGGGGTVGTIGVGTQVAAVGDNDTFWAHHYVATGKTLSTYVLNFWTSGNQVAKLHLRAKNPLNANDVDNQITEELTTAISGPVTTRQLTIPIKVVGPARIVSYVISIGTNTPFFTSWDYTES